MAAPGSSGTVLEVDGNQFAYKAGRIYFKPALALVATAVLFLVHSLSSGFGRREVLVIIAVLVSIPALFMYPLLTPRNGKPPRRGLLPMVVALGAFIAYFLGCYLTFYEGLWGLWQLIGAFSLSLLLWSLSCGAMGVAIVNGMYRLTELCRAVDEGRIIVRSSGQ